MSKAKNVVVHVWVPVLYFNTAYVYFFAVHGAHNSGCISVVEYWSLGNFTEQTGMCSEYNLLHSRIYGHCIAIHCKTCVLDSCLLIDKSGRIPERYHI